MNGKFKVWEIAGKNFVDPNDFLLSHDGRLYTKILNLRCEPAHDFYVPVYSTGQVDIKMVDLLYDDIVKDLSGGLLVMKWDKELSML